MRIPGRIRLILALKWTLLKRFVRQTPFFYSAAIMAMGGFIAYALTKIEIHITWKSLLAVVLIQWFIMSRIRYSREKQIFLRQTPRFYFSFLLTDVLLSSLPFLFINGWLWVSAATTAIAYAIFKTTVSGKTTRWRTPITIPLFVKSAYLWQSKQRYVLPMAWSVSIILIVIAYIHQNYNLAVVACTLAAFIAFFSTIMQQEKVDFIHMYCHVSHFIKQTLRETVINAALFLLPLVSPLYIFFPMEWKTTAITTFGMMLLSIQLLWIKYAFYPSVPLASMLFLLGIVVQGMLAITVYGIIFIPIFSAFLYYLCRKQIQQIIVSDEKIDY